MQLLANSIHNTQHNANLPTNVKWAAQAVVDGSALLMSPARGRLIHEVIEPRLISWLVHSISSSAHMNR
jgi:hypothetical protein